MKIAVIGSGFAGLSAASFLAKEGHEVTVFEKNNQVGGRAQSFSHDGFSFDMGPSWYWMPDVFERYFNQFDKTVSDYYDLIRLDPGYKVFFENDSWKIPAKMQSIEKLFETEEKGSGKALRNFLSEAAFKYEVGIKKLVYKPGLQLSELIDQDLFKGLLKLDVFNSMSSHVKKRFKSKKLRQLLEFPVLFLGAKPSKTPALYSLMNYADLSLGTWYPKGGMVQIVNAMHSLCLSLGVVFETNAEVQQIIIDEKQAAGLKVNGIDIGFDIVVGAADYHHIEQHLLPKQHRQYSQSYWDKRTLAPSSLIFYVGLDKKVPGIEHHNLFFDTDFESHAKEIYDNPQWPKAPLFYVSATSKTDDTAPEGCENLFILIPVAPDMNSDSELRNKYFEMVMKRLEERTGESLTDHVIFKKDFAHEEFISEYHSFKGNAYGLANTLLQTAHLKPKLRSPKVDRLYYCGQLTVPGPGVPPSLISGEVVKNIIQSDIKKYNYESNFRQRVTAV